MMTTGAATFHLPDTGTQKGDSDMAKGLGQGDRVIEVGFKCGSSIWVLNHHTYFTSLWDS